MSQKREGYVTYIVILILIVELAIAVNVSAHPGSHNLSVSTGTVDLSFGVKVKCDYKMRAVVSHPSTLKPDEKSDWEVSLSGGAFEISVYVPSPLNKWYSTSVSVPIGSQVDVPLITGLRARVRSAVSSSIDVTGPGISDKKSLLWTADGSKSFTITAKSTAKRNEEVKVEISPKAQITVGVVIDFLLFRKEIGSTSLGSFSFNPISESIIVKKTEGILGLQYQYIILGLLLGTFILWLLSRQLRTRSGKGSGGP